MLLLQTVQFGPGEVVWYDPDYVVLAGALTSVNEVREFAA